jgi:hypothetical protein
VTNDSNGAQVIVKDPRVTSAAEMIRNGLTVLALAFVANNLYQVNLTLAADAVWKEQMMRELAALKASQMRNADLDDRQEDHINAVDRRLVGVEQAMGKTLRGGRPGGQ